MAGALVGSVLAAAPAQADTPSTGLLDGIVAPIPGIDGLGSITGPDGYQCVSSDPSSLLTCAALPLDLGGLLDPPDTLLQAVPADGWQFESWSGCPDPTGSTCMIQGGLLDSLVKPIANFVRVPSGGGTTDTTPPQTEITENPKVDAQRSTSATDATFAFQALEKDRSATPGATFTCTLTGPGRTGSAEDCTSPTSYDNLEPGDYTFAVQATDDAGNTDDSPATFTWTVAGADTAPQTYLTGGPRNRGWLLKEFTAFGLSSTAKGAKFACRYDGKPHKCDAQLALLNIGAGTHRVIAAAKANGHTDATPAHRVFTRPLNNLQLKHSKGWHKRAHKRPYFLGSFSQTRKKGARLVKGARHIKRIALVATKKRGGGTVKVFLNHRLLKKVHLRAHKLRRHRVIPVATFRHRRHGRVRVVVTSRHRLVRIEGLGIAHR